MRVKLKKLLLCTSVIFGILIVKDNCFAQMQNALSVSPDDIIENYTHQVTNPNSAEIKKITLINNTANIIYPVVRVYNIHDKHEYRIYVGTFVGGGQQLGLPENQKAVVSIPTQLWNAGRVEIFTRSPEIPESPKVKNPLQAIDVIPQSSNKGDLIYRNDSALGFPLDARSQLAEYTFETNDDGSDKHVVDYDISYVDEIYLPLAAEVEFGTMGYMGSNLSVDELQQNLDSFYLGKFTQNYFGNDTKLGWPVFNLMNYHGRYDDHYFKIPGAYNVFALKDSRTSYNQDFYMLTFVGAPPSGKDAAVIEGLVNRWTSWLSMPVKNSIQLCEKDQNPEFCHNFSDTVNFVWNTVIAKFPSLKDHNDKIVEKLVGYDFPADFDPRDPPKFDRPNVFRDAVKSLLRGVPYPYWSYDANTYWYPSPNATDDNNQPNEKQKYNLDPLVWFVHQKLKMSGYGFSIDDDTANVEAPGNGFIITVGGINGLPNKSPYDSNTQQAVLFAPGWLNMTATHLGDCQLNRNTGTNCPVSLNPQAFQSAEISLSTDQERTNTLTFTIQYGDKNSSGVYPLVIDPAKCTVTGKLNPSMCSMLKNDPNKPQFFIVPQPEQQ